MPDILNLFSASLDRRKQPKSSCDVQSLARLGAERRLSELAEEARSILAAFPDLHRSDLPFSHTSARRPGNGAAADGLQHAGNGRQRSPMTAAQRKAVSLRMKKYWAARRAETLKG
jgi:hypothetical protein